MFFSFSLILSKISSHKRNWPSISSQSNPRTMPPPRTRLLKRFVLITLCCKTKHLRSLVRAIVQGFEWLKILGFRKRQDQICIQQHCFPKYKDRFRLTSKLQKWYSLHSGRVTPSFIYSWFISHILEPKFFYLGCFDSSGQ